MVDSKETYTTESKTLRQETIEHVSLKADSIAIATAEEHNLSMKDALLNNKRIVWWCFFFAMSAIGWWVFNPSERTDIAVLLTITQGVRRPGQWCYDISPSIPPKLWVSAQDLMVTSAPLLTRRQVYLRRGTCATS